MSTGPDREHGNRLHHAAIVVDMHADTPTGFFLRDGYDFGQRHEEGHLDLPRMVAGGIDVEAFVAWVPAELGLEPGAAPAHTKRVLLAIRDVLDRTNGIRAVENWAALQAALAEGDRGGLLAIEGGHALDGSLERLAEYHGLGVRYLTLTWNNTHDWADACCSPPRHGGLSAHGRRIVREMERLGVMVDVSHAAETTFYHVLEELSGPFIASHSCARALADHPRNLSDDQLRELAAAGGVVGVNFFPAFLDFRFGQEYEVVERQGRRLEARLLARGLPTPEARQRVKAFCLKRWLRIPAVPKERIGDHIEHIASVAGIGCVGLGTDFDGIPVLPDGVGDAADLPLVTEDLVRRGFSDEDVRAVLGANFLRLFEAVLV